MKVPNDLRVAIRLAAKKQNKRKHSYSQRSLENKEAVAELYKRKPAIQKKVEALRKKAEEHREQAEKLFEQISSFGIEKHYDSLIDIDSYKAKFVKAGGKLPEYTLHIDPDEVIASLAAAETQEAFDEILKCFGIHWK